MSPKRFGDRWEIVRQIGEGGQSHIFLVRDLSGEVKEECILKRLRNINRIERFEREIRAGIELNHPGIAPIFDFSLGSPPYFVTRHYPGPTLTEIAPLKPLQALSLFIGICDPVAYAHERGVVHRDLKPDNIILNADNTPVILDFGLCYIEDEEHRITATMEQVGSRFYIAPELEAGRSGEVTASVDSYALGKILYFLLTARPIARENYIGQNDLCEVLGDPQLGYVTERILANSVVENPSGGRIGVRSTLLTSCEMCRPDPYVVCLLSALKRSPLNRGVVIEQVSAKSKNFCAIQNFFCNLL